MAAQTSRALATALGAESQWLRAMARALVGDSDADDLVQDAMESALKHPPDTDRPLRPWLRTVAKNAARMRWRSTARRKNLEGRLAPADRDPSDPKQAVEKLELRRDLMQAVIELDEPYRETIVLCYVDGLKAVEIARRQEVPAATVRSRLKRGLEMLRNDLDRKSGGERSHWQRAMVPLLLPPTAAPATGAIITGVLLMKITAAAATAAVAVALTIGLWPNDNDDASAAAVQVSDEDPQAEQPSPATAPAPAGAEPDDSERSAPRRFDSPGARQRFAAALAKQKTLRARRAEAPASSDSPASPASSKPTAKLPTVQLDKAYIRDRIGEIIPMVRECYELSLHDQPELAGTLTIDFVIDAEEEVGGYVREARLDESSDLRDPALSECMVETILSIEFVAPEGGGEVRVRYPFRFSTGDASAN